MPTWKQINDFLNEQPPEGASEADKLAHAVGWAVKLTVWVFLGIVALMFLAICLTAGLTSGSR